MSHRIAEKERRRQERLAAEADAARAARRRRLGFLGGGALLVLALVTAAFALPGGDEAGGERTASRAGGPALAPAFTETDVVTGKTLSLADLRGRRTLFFFSEGASCQACLVQAAELQDSQALKRRRVGVVSVSTDSPETLRQVRDQYRITHPLIADEDRSMSSAWGQLGRGGMGHPDTDGHSFVLVDGRGRIVWDRAYQEMYVPMKRLLADMDV